ncbi:hypothetical protein [Bradyrhizobium sp. 153]|uniref:hypothetical protein n=1 Tax=Bradyrhizobium sp. 153 TaxID=2782627 RepID=UPI001FFAD8E8|nr:hypothetical protein [Bradyrhizobium sp. 153]MCK1669447.1 hypothetical protein [Bradyrhizobium sp. 153]
MTTNPIEQIGGLTSSANVPKADIVAWGKGRVAQVLADVSELRSTTLAGQNAVQVKSLKQAYYIDVADTTTADDGVSCIVSADGFRFKPAKLLPTGNIVGDSDAQTLTNKAIDGGSNTLTNIAIASLAAIGAATLLGNPAAAGAPAEEFSIQSLAELLTPHFASDFILAYDHTSGQFRKIAPKTLVPEGSVDTIAALKGTDKTSRARMQVNGYYTLGDCRPRVYWYDSTDTTSSDNGGTIIVATDGARWKLIGPVSVKMFGARDNGTDQTTAVTTALNYAATTGVPLDFDGAIFSVTQVVITGKSGLRFGRGGLVGLAGSATDSILTFINCVDVTFYDHFSINGNYNTNYSYGLHGYTTGAGQSVQYFNLTNVIFNACKIGWAFGSTSRSDDTISEINFFGGRTYGCPGIGIGIGKNTVVNTHGCTWQSDFGTSPGSWGSLPNIGLEAKGATLNINGGELLYVLNTTGSLTAITGLSSGTGNVYGNINVKDAVVECANMLASTGAAGVLSPSGGAINFSGCRTVFTTDVVGGSVQLEASFAGRVTIVGNSGFSVNARTQWNINAVSNTTAIITTDMQSFGVNCLQGYAGLNGGAQQIVIDGDCAAWTASTPTVTAQSGTITTLGTCAASYLRSGKSVEYTFDIQITTAGTAAQAIKVSLPFPAKAGKNFVGAVYEYDTAGAAGTAAINPTVNDANNVYIRNASGGSFFANGRKVTGTIKYEMA